MGLPIIDISFKQLSKTAALRSERGIVALILKDTNTLKFTVNDESDIVSSITEANKKYIKDCLKGNVNKPNKILVYVIGTSDTLDNALSYFESQEFTLLCMPSAEVGDNTKIKAFIKKMNDVVKYRTDAILTNEVADYEGIYNYTASGIKVGGESVTTKDHLSRVAGLIEGTPLSQSVTFSVLDEVEEVETLTKEQADARINKGELILVREMGKVRIARGVTSLTTLQEPKGDAMKKIKLRKITNLIHNDLRKVIVEKYIGKVPNNYDNKCILITEIASYLDDLALEQLIEKAITVGIDIEAQKKWLKENTTLDVNSMTEQEIKEANTQDKVFLAISIKLIDAMEEIFVNVAL